MKILVINAGSSSIKYALFFKEKVLSRGLIDRIGIRGSTFSADGKTTGVNIPFHEAGFRLLFAYLQESKKIQSLKDIGAVGHRVVHGGATFKKSVSITPDVKAAIRKSFAIAPLHNPPNYEGILICEKILDSVPQVAVFDTAFHHNMPAKAYTYAIPRMLAAKYGIRKYGFHGTSHQYVCNEAARVLRTPISKLKLISCHLGNGCSVAAVKGGRSVDTSMGFTPLEGLVMGTRSGDIDPALVSFLIEHEHLTTKEMDALLNKQSGMLGISGISRDFRELLSSGKKEAALAVDVFVYRLAKYIGAYTAAMQGCDAIIFTAGIGENSAVVREKTCNYLKYAGLLLDRQKNQKNKPIISSPRSKMKVLVIPTQEDMMIMRETVAHL
ncbi:acetate kinase [Candidatus Woesearchaeota archaeon]|nr:acetate kinase [Candidatus Woesearchaeota archaeon]